MPATAGIRGITIRGTAAPCRTRIATLRTDLTAGGAACGLRNYPRTPETFGLRVQRGAAPDCPGTWAADLVQVSYPRTLVLEIARAADVVRRASFRRTSAVTVPEPEDSGRRVQRVESRREVAASGADGADLKAWLIGEGHSPEVAPAKPVSSAIAVRVAWAEAGSEEAVEDSGEAADPAAAAVAVGVDRSEKH